MALLGLLYPIALSAVAQEARSEIAVDGKFDGKKGGQATDLSGIACRPEDESGYSCVVVNDESPFAQFATLRNGRLIAGFKIDLLAGRGRRLADETPPSGVFGSEAAGRPIVAERCSDRKIESDFDEFDGEGVAWAPTGSGGIFYVVGSHACSRSSGTRRRSTHLLARIPVDRAGQVSGEPELTWRLGQALRRANFVAGHYGLPLNASQQGLDIEGVAALNGGEDLLFGLRAPSLDGHGFMVRARAADLFADTSGPPPTAHVVRLQLGERVGIRDLAALPDGRVLVLTGSAQEQSGVPQRLALVSPTEEPLWTMQTLLPEVALPRPQSKAEGVAVLGVAADRVRVLVLFEDVSKDLPVEYALILPDR
jgi:hypothetical protein